MRARSATVGDLETVFCDLSKRMVAEYIAAGKDAKLAYDDLMMNMKEGRAHALVQGDDVVAIISWRESDDATNTLLRPGRVFQRENGALLQEAHPQDSGAFRQYAHSFTNLAGPAGNYPLVPDHRLSRKRK